MSSAQREFGIGKISAASVPGYWKTLETPISRYPTCRSKNGFPREPLARNKKSLPSRNSSSTGGLPKECDGLERIQAAQKSVISKPFMPFSYDREPPLSPLMLIDAKPQSDPAAIESRAPVTSARAPSRRTGARYCRCHRGDWHRVGSDRRASPLRSSRNYLCL